MGPPARFYKTGRYVFRQRALAAGGEVTKQIESLQQLGRGRRAMEFKMREQERRELTHATVALVEPRQKVKCLETLKFRGAVHNWMERRQGR